jgi:hypothetical protein
MSDCLFDFQHACLTVLLNACLTVSFKLSAWFSIKLTDWLTDCLLLSFLLNSTYVCLSIPLDGTSVCQPALCPSPQPIYLFVYPHFFNLSVSTFVFLFMFQSAHLSVYLSVNLPLCLFVLLVFTPFCCSFICLFICLSVHLSIHNVYYITWCIALLSPVKNTNLSEIGIADIFCQTSKWIFTFQFSEIYTSGTVFTKLHFCVNYNWAQKAK